MMRRKIRNIVLCKNLQEFIVVVVVGHRVEDDGGRAERHQDRLPGRQEPGIRLQPHQRHPRPHQEYAAHVSASFLACQTVQNTSVVDPGSVLILVG